MNFMKEVAHENFIKMPVQKLMKFAKAMNKGLNNDIQFDLLSCKVTCQFFTATLFFATHT